MRARFRRLGELILISLCTFGLALCFAAAPLPAQTRTVKIGFVLPLSGEWSFLGNRIRDGALLAKTDLAAGGEQVELLFEDNRGELAASAAIGSKLVSVDAVDGLISIISGVGQLMKPLANRAGIIHVGICSEPEVADGKYSFINYLTAQQGVSRYLKEFRRRYGAGGTLGIFALNESGFQRILKELDWQAGDELKIAFRESYNAGAKDFRSELARAAAKKPDAILVLGLSPEIELIAKQAGGLGIRAPLTSIESFGLAADKSAFEGSWFIDSAVPNPEFQARFKAVYGRDVTPGTGHAYDTVMMIGRSFGGGVSRGEGIKRFRSITGYRGVIGSLDVHSDGVIWSEASVKQIAGGAAVMQGEGIEPSRAPAP